MNKHNNPFERIIKNRTTAALIATGAIALAGCGAKENNPSHETASTGTVPVAASTPNASKETLTPAATPEAHHDMSFDEVRQIIHGDETGGTAYVRESGQTAEEVILNDPATKLWMEQTGVNADQLKDALESPYAHVRQYNDTHLNNDDHSEFNITKEVPQGEDLSWRIYD